MLLVKAVELEIQKIEAAQAKRHVQLLTAFLPETFVRRGGELHCTLCAVLLVHRTNSRFGLSLGLFLSGKLTNNLQSYLVTQPWHIG